MLSKILDQAQNSSSPAPAGKITASPRPNPPAVEPYIYIEDTPIPRKNCACPELTSKRLKILAVESKQHKKFADFLGLHPELHQNEVAIVFFLASKESPQTLKTYASCLTTFFNEVEHDFDMVHMSHLQGYVRKMKAMGRKSNTINTHVGTLKSFYRYLEDAGIIFKSPTFAIKALTIHSEDKRGDRVLSVEEIKIILDEAKKKEQEGPGFKAIRDYFVLKILYHCGIRSVEVVRLKWKDFFLDIQGRWWIGVHGKGSKNRQIQIPAPVCNEFLIYRNFLWSVPTNTPSAPNIAQFPMFPNARNATKMIKERAISRLVKEAGLVVGRNMSPHDHRHTFATHARMAGVSIETLQIDMGHKSPETTRIYDASIHIRRESSAQYIIDMQKNSN